MTQTKDSSLLKATFGAGCFWCVEAVFQKLKGVHSVESGYMGGQTNNPNYSEVCSGMSGHAEVTQIHFDPSVITYEILLNWFWRSHDPTTLNRQGADVGTQYRSVVFYHDWVQRDSAEVSKKEAQKQFSESIVTEITAASTFYRAEVYHQNYYSLNPEVAYCKMVINPKLEKLGLG